MNPIKTIIVDDHKIIREGLYNLLKRDKNIDVIGEAENGRTAVHLTKKLNPDIVIMDLAMPDLNGIDATRQIIRRGRRVKVIALSMHTDIKYVRSILDSGASGYILKEDAYEELSRAIKIVIKGGIFLSKRLENTLTSYQEKAKINNILSNREREVLQLLSEGKNTKEIAHILLISSRTVESHKHSIMKKLNKHSLPDLIKYSFNIGLITLDL